MNTDPIWIRIPNPPYGETADFWSVLLGKRRQSRAFNPESKDRATALSKDRATALSKDRATARSKDRATARSKDRATALSKDRATALSKVRATALSKDRANALRVHSTTEGGDMQ